MSQSYRIHCLVPDLPEPATVMPFLEEMHANRWYSNFGPLVKRFEDEITDFLERENGALNCSVATFSSATTALELALRAMQLPDGAKVLVPALTFPATALVVMNAGLTPVLADVDASTWELTPEIAREACTQDSYVAVIPVAAFGRPVESAPWAAFQKETGIPVVLDVAAALGQQDIDSALTYCFSLHATKPFGVGEGGLLVSGNDDLIVQSRRLSNFGFREGGGGVVLQAGTNAKFSEYFAAMGLVQMGRWREVIARRQVVWDQYEARLKSLGNAIRFQAGAGDFIPAVFPVYIEGKAQAVISRMDAAGIQTRRWYLPPLYEHPALSHLGYARKDGEPFPVCEALKPSLVGLPFHGFLSETDIQEICDIVAEEAV